MYLIYDYSLRTLLLSSQSMTGLVPNPYPGIRPQPAVLSSTMVACLQRSPFIFKGSKSRTDFLLVLSRNNNNRGYHHAASEISAVT
jgi:hypothetical protein